MSVPARFVHIGIAFSGEVPDLSKIEEVFQPALDWIRYGPQSWVLYTTTELDTWRDRLRACPVIKEADPFLLTEFKVGEYSGYQRQAFWDWIHKSR
jgi:hypothetical protein